MGELIYFQEARKKAAPSNVEMLYRALKSSGLGQMLIDMVIEMCIRDRHLAVITDSCVEIMPERVILLAASIERPEEIDINRALAAKRRADERLRQKQSQQEYYQTQAALSRALARLKSRGRE